MIGKAEIVAAAFSEIREENPVKFDLDLVFGRLSQEYLIPGILKEIEYQREFDCWLLRRIIEMERRDRVLKYQGVWLWE